MGVLDVVALADEPESRLWGKATEQHDETSPTHGLERIWVEESGSEIDAVFPLEIGLDVPEERKDVV